MAREELYEQFGPALIEAVALVVMDEINILRAQHSLPDRTASQIVTAIESKMTTIPTKIYRPIEPE